ncbi:hypothetical protein [Ottowia sp. SB7-C50]|uniref:hypothetical protein n=1 Tax=Ottowia sp. SB7-C50 TaxID=3081231 RepID=UPI002955B1C2|nr:hypothetical protein [Ottowia sp. SB7-C50]WOP16834.1 hypothetical protein R0D99_07560 [Ottowia sp. SB7-C50]
MKHVALIAVVAACLAPLAASAQNAAGTGPAMEHAQAELAADHWRTAFDEFAVLADQGDAEAARTAYQMWLYAPRLYGQVFPARLDQVQRWQALCGCAGDARVRRPALSPSSGEARG